MSYLDFSSIDEHTSIGNGPIPLPPCVSIALEVLESAGFEAWCVGGFVRDAIMGRPCSDIDIATNASWQETQRTFECAGYATHETGVAHGTLTVIVCGSPLEITTYRADGSYSDKRRPDSVRFVSSIEEDLARRDFTVNAIAYHPERGIVDPFGGAKDIEAGIIRTVGNAERRFSEDALRILRGCRFRSQLGFSIESRTLAAMKACKNLLSHISAERIANELDLLLLGNYVHDALMDTVDVLAFVIPELAAMKGFDQKTPYHIYDAFEHTAWVVQNTPPQRLLRWAALLHDMGKPAAAFEDGDVRHFYGHARISVKLGQRIMRELLMSPALIDDVLLLVQKHDDVVEPNPRAIKRMLGKLGGNVELFRSLCALKKADALAQAPQCWKRAETADELLRILDGILEANEAFSLKHLNINGHDVIKLGITAGPLVGEALNAALAAVIDEAVPNEHEALSAFVSNWIEARISGEA